jgi:hypothetical protein
MHLEDRRRKRSCDPLIALHYQLSRARHDGSLETIVLADPSGVVVAGAGAWAACEELAAYAPLLARPEDGEAEAEGGAIASMRSEVEVRQLEVSGQEVLLCARGASGQAIDRWALDLTMQRASEGISRILSAA